MDPSKKTMSVPEAGKLYYDLSRNASYEAARRGEIPTVRIGRLLRVPVAAMERHLEEAVRCSKRSSMLGAVEK
jgi:excisionase family DNA binding protein